MFWIKYSQIKKILNQTILQEKSYPNRVLGRERDRKIHKVGVSTMLWKEKLPNATILFHSIWWNPQLNCPKIKLSFVGEKFKFSNYKKIQKSYYLLNSIMQRRLLVKQRSRFINNYKANRLILGIYCYIPTRKSIFDRYTYKQT